MGIKTKILNLIFAEGHDEPVSNLDRLDGVGVESKGSDK